MIAKLVFGPRSRRRLYAVRRLKVVNGTLARGQLLGIYQARSAEAAVRAARRDFPDCALEILAAVDQVASLLAISGEALVYPAVVAPPARCSSPIMGRIEPSAPSMSPVTLEGIRPCTLQPKMN
jgi:hypothetical protein